MLPDRMDEVGAGGRCVLNLLCRGHQARLAMGLDPGPKLVLKVLVRIPIPVPLSLGLVPEVCRNSLEPAMQLDGECKAAMSPGLDVLFLRHHPGRAVFGVEGIDLPP